MGLEQVDYAKEHEEIQSATCLKAKKYVEVATWRKHPNLQGYMENLWRKRGWHGDFNCVDVELSKDDILELNSVIIKGDLPKTSGFFYGNDADEYYKKDDLAICVEALKLIQKGNKIYYSSWW